MREEGYTETGGGDGINLQVAPYYANSLRGSLGSDFKTNFDLLGATISPEARLGYRYDLVDSPVKLKAGFASTGGLARPTTPSLLSVPIRTPAMRWPASAWAPVPIPGSGRQLRLDPRQQRFHTQVGHLHIAGPKS